MLPILISPLITTRLLFEIDTISGPLSLCKIVHFADQNPDALVILCSDHGNPNPGLSSGANGADAFFRNASKFECSHTSILDRINAESSKEYIQKAIREVASLDIPMEHAALMQDRLRGKYSAAYSRMSGLHAIIGQIIANHTEIGWMSNTHTSDHVELWRLWTRQ